MYSMCSASLQLAGIGKQKSPDRKRVGALETLIHSVRLRRILRSKTNLSRIFRFAAYKR